MVDRQDIDALLIGSLYGELSSTEEARLSAHLESHPADRTALVNLTRAREVVRESRILQVQFDPPQAVSALLMQEAVRRAPKVRDEQSWFQRFMRTFIAHPAMAAAATLVLVVGVAGTVYMKKGDHFAKATKDDAPALSMTPSSSSPSSSSPSPTAGPSAADKPAAATEQSAKDSKEFGRGIVASDEGQNAEGIANGRQLSQGSADNFQVKLDDGDAGKPADRIVVSGERTRELDEKKKAESNELGFRGGADKNQTQAKPKANKPVTTTLSKETPSDDLDQPTLPNTEPSAVAKKPEPTKADPAKPEPSPDPKVAKTAKPTTPTTQTTPKKTPPRLEVTTPTQAPKDLGSVASSRDDQSRKGDATGAGAGGTASRTNDSRPGNASPPPAPPPPPPASTVAVDEKEKRAQEKAATELAWAKERHGRLIAAVKAGKCELAATIAVDIANRNSTYYATTVADDRFIKPCAQYITAQREREAERVQRAKATQRRAVDEAPAPAPSQSSK
jgi:hypothetical protein